MIRRGAPVRGSVDAIHVAIVVGARGEGRCVFGSVGVVEMRGVGGEAAKESSYGVGKVGGCGGVGRGSVEAGRGWRGLVLMLVRHDDHRDVNWLWRVC